MKKLLLIVVLGLLWCNVSLAEEIYISCNVGMKDDRSTKKMRTLPKDKYKPIKRFGFQYFKFDNAKSEITIHEQIGSKKPSKVGSIIIDYEGKNFVEFEIKNSENEIDKYKLYSRNLSNKGAWQSFNFEGSVYLKSGSQVFDYDFRNTICLPPTKNGEIIKPPKDEKIYKKWIKKGF